MKPLALIPSCALALTLALAGCAAPTASPSNAAANPSGNGASASDPVLPASFLPANSELGKLSPTVQTASTPIGQGLAEGLAEERDMDDLAALSGPSGASIIAAGSGNIVSSNNAGIIAAGSGNLIAGDRHLMAVADASATVAIAASAALVPGAPAVAVGHANALAALAAQKLAARRAALAAIATNARRARLGANVSALGQKIQAAGAVDNGDGTETRTITTSVMRRLYGYDVQRNVTFAWTEHRATHLRVHSRTEFSVKVLDGPLKGVVTHTLREVGAQADGSTQTSFRHVVIGAKGGIRVSAWQKTISPEGLLTGTGTLSWYAPGYKLLKQLSIALEGTDAAPVARAEDPATHTNASVALPVNGEPQARVKDTQSGLVAKASVGTTASASEPVAP